MLPSLAIEFYATQQRVVETTKLEVGRLWDRRVGEDLDASWRRVGPHILALIAEAQSEMALVALDYNHQILDFLDIPDQPEGEFNPDSLVGTASDGRRLDTLAAQAVVTAKVAIGEGASAQQGIEAGGQWVRLMSGLQVADTARVAVGIGTASRKNVAGNVRVVNPPVCQRCAILGGRFYRWSTGFDRHPHDDCTMMPVKSRAEGERWATSPDDLLRNGDIKDLTQAQLKAIDEGAELTDVVNTYRGMSTTATVRRLSLRKIHVNEKAAAEAYRASLAAGHPDLLGSLGGLPRAGSELVRLTPEGIYKQARTRDEAIELLRRWGYIK